MGNFVPPSFNTSDRIVASIATAHGLTDSTSSLDPKLFSVAREFAFSCDNASEFAYWYQASSVFSKFDSGDEDSASRRVDVAMAGFSASEQACAVSNGRLVDVWTRAHLSTGVWKRARRYIAAVLGKFPWESFPRACGFGPGASSGLSRRESCHQNKWVRSSHITQAALPYYLAFRQWALIEDLPAYVQIVAGNRVTTVPKSYKTDRTIAIEPDWNMFFQKGVGKLIRQRLRRLGVLRKDAQEYHAQLARLGSWTGHLATLDLSAASDSISLALCEALLPSDWWSVIQDLRSPQGELADGTVVTYEKVSSMGNGYTFELETLLFYCLTLAACRKETHDNVSVYGDDIICPTEHAQEVINLLREAGFETNSEKTFIDGPFRESCGGHYWRGVDVTPWFCRSHPALNGDLISLGNQMLSWAARFPEHRKLVERAYSLCKRHLPRALRGPYQTEGCLWSEWDESVPRWHSDTQSYTQLAIQREHKYDNLQSHKGAYLHKLWIADDELRATLLAKATTREKVVQLHVDREQWVTLPVRLT